MTFEGAIHYYTLFDLIGADFLVGGSDINSFKRT